MYGSNIAIIYGEKALEFIHQNAEKHILNRGLNYFLEGNIFDVSFDHKFNTFNFLIKGSSIYSCSFEFDYSISITSSHCDCPYEDFCKHQVAAGFWLKENRKEIEKMLHEDENDKKAAKEVVQKPKPKVRYSKEPLLIPNYLDLDLNEMNRSLISYDTQRLTLYGYELLNRDENTYSGDVIFADPYSFRDETKAFEVSLKHTDNGLAVSCSCNVRVKKLCSHAFALLYILKEEDLLHHIQNKSKEIEEETYQRIANSYGITLNEDLRTNFQKVLINGKHGYMPTGKYKNLMSPELLDDLADHTNTENEAENILSFKVSQNQSDIYQLGFAFWFSPHITSNTKLVPITGTYGRKQLPMEVKLAEYRKDKYMNVEFKQGDRLLIDLSERLESGFVFPTYEMRNSALVESIGQHIEYLENHPYLYVNDGNFGNDIRKSTLKKVKFVAGLTNIHIEIEQKGEFVETNSFILQNDEKIKLTDKAIEEKNEFFISVKDHLYFLSETAEVTQLQLLMALQDKRISIQKFPIYFEKQIQHLGKTRSIIFKNFKDFEVKKKKIKPVQKELYLSELDHFVIFRPYIRFNDDSLLEAKRANKKLELSQKTITEKSFDQEYARDFIELMEGAHPTFSQQKMASFYHLTYRELIDNNAFFQIFSKLTEADVKIFGLKNLKKLKVNPHQGKVVYKVESGLDWFDINGGIFFGDEYISLEDLQKKFIPGSAFVELSGGQKGMIPEEWLKKLEELFSHAETKNKKLKLSKKHFSLVDRLFNEIEDETIIAEIAEKRQKLLNFNQVNHYPIPENVQATLRHYQEDGFQWMCFLDEFQWGGILADDMGLGKTLQVITFLSHVLKKNKQTNLVVVPTSLLFNWENELKKFAPHLNVHFYYGSDRIKSTNSFDEYDIVFTSYGHMLADVKILKEFEFNYVILDESQAIKNASSKRFKAARLLQANNRIAMTGTPIENNTFDLYAQMSFLNPGFLGSAKTFKTNYAAAIDKDRDKEKAKNLQQLIKPFVLRRTKDQVATELPDKTEDILYCEMGKEQRKVYDAMRNAIRDSIQNKIEEEGLNNARFSVLEGLTQLRLVCDSPEIVAGEEKYGTESAKLKILKDHIEENTPNHKILIFSQFVKMLKVIEKELQEMGMEYAYLDGQSNQKQRQENVNKFQEDDDCRIFLISLKAGGTGLNLMAADYVYLVDPWWNPAVENQAIDRCYRIGQDKKVIAYRMICKNTIEEKILDLKSRKTAIAGDIISTDENTLKQLDKDDILALFE